MNAMTFVLSRWTACTRLRRALLLLGVAGGGTLLLASTGKSTPRSGILYAHQFTGADAGSQISACIQALPSTGGICDFRELTGKQTASKTIAVDKPVQLLLGAMTLTGKASPVINLLSPGAEIICSGRDNTIISALPNVTAIGLHNKSRIAHCTLRGPRAPGGTGKGIDSGGPNGASDVVVEDNIIEQWSVQGINIADRSSGWFVRGNTIRDNDDEGILLGNRSSDIVVDGNIIYGNGRNAIDVTGHRNIIHGNILRNNGGTGKHASDQYGILLYSTGLSGPVSDNIITDNAVTGNNAHGIVLAAAPNGTVARNLVSGNVVIGNGIGSGSWGDGIHLEVAPGSNGNLQNNSVVHNIVEGSHRHGINLEAQPSVTGAVAQNIISGNQVIGNRGRGIFIPYSTPADTQVLHNIVLNNSVSQVTNSGTRTTMSGNKTDIVNDARQETAH